ncbi:MAG: hypothetical protein Ta2G_16110 [Termitinemataceae bacterium]|nr:MAG: hypothetical protein Ta2G_16110 [Termitinemataceae bacterium]
MIKLDIKDNKANFTISGSLDADTSPRLTANLENLSGMINEIVFDFTGLEYMSSMGLRAILSAYKIMKAPRRGGTFRVKNIPPNIKEVFELSGFMGAFQRDEKLVILEKMVLASEAEYALLGELDSSTASMMEKTFDTLKGKRIKKLSLDCENLKTISATGCRSLRNVSHTLFGGGGGGGDTNTQCLLCPSKRYRKRRAVF